ncbi:hypothetical protein DFJ77DRAFT_457748 [Powellomyces hirtus]|nr:hypothetical protein DFJ77DRAFT_457748 [Powellomyces hirtus]
MASSACRTSFTNQLAVDPSRTNIAMPPAATGVVPCCGGVSTICAGSYTLNFEMMMPGPFAPCKMSVFKSSNYDTAWWLEPPAATFDYANNGSCGLMFDEDTNLGGWALAGWQKFGYYWQTMKMDLKPQSADDDVARCRSDTATPTSTSAIVPMTTTSTFSSLSTDESVQSGTKNITPIDNGTNHVVMAGAIGGAVGGVGLAAAAGLAFWGYKRRAIKNAGVMESGGLHARSSAFPGLPVLPHVTAPSAAANLASAGDNAKVISGEAPTPMAAALPASGSASKRNSAKPSQSPTATSPADGKASKRRSAEPSNIPPAPSPVEEDLSQRNSPEAHKSPLAPSPVEGDLSTSRLPGGS